MSQCWIIVAALVHTNWIIISLKVLVIVLPRRLRVDVLTLASLESSGKMLVAME